MLHSKAVKLQTGDRVAVTSPPWPVHFYSQYRLSWVSSATRGGKLGAERTGTPVFTLRPGIRDTQAIKRGGSGVPNPRRWCF